MPAGHGWPLAGRLGLFSRGADVVDRRRGRDGGAVVFVGVGSGVVFAAEVREIMGRPKLQESPRGHLRIAEVAGRLAHSVRWVRQRIQSGDLEAYRWAANDVTVSEASVRRLEDAARVQR